ncbi:MAG: hypothetical protein DMD34_07115 [Gemmatimonadetes bacterium]|nr:MAG: hypothetical protein DMD34_07115 [Gemmatimonadota bacterium]
MTNTAPLHQPIPVDRSILWGPVDSTEESGGGSAAKRPGHIPFPVFLSQAAITAINEHLATPTRPGQGILGFLLGDVCECPNTNVSYLVIDAALRLTQAIYGDRTRDVVTRLWDRIQEQLEAQKAHLIGWYHTHPPLPLSLTDHDVETHEHYFGEAWQVALLLATAPAEPAGALFRSGADAQWVATPLPFYELLAPESIRPDGKKRSFITWKNHRAYNPTTPAAAPTLRTPAAKRPSEPKFTPAPAGAPPPPPPPPPPSTPPPPSPARQSAVDDRHELKFLTAAEDMPPPPPPRPATPLPPPPPPRQHAPPPRPAPPPPPVPTREPEPEPEPEAEPEEEPVPAAEAAWPDEFEEPSGAEEVLDAPEPPPRRPRRRWRPSRRFWRTLAVLLIVGGAAGAYWWFQPEVPLPTWSSVTARWSGLTSKASAFAARTMTAVKAKFRRTPATPARPQPEPAVRQTTRPAAPAASGGSPPPLPPGRVQPPPTRLDALADSLTAAVRTFGERSTQFARGQLLCAGLGTALKMVESRWTAYSAARRSAGALEAAQAARDQTLYAGVDSVERRFEQTGCARP